MVKKLSENGINSVEKNAKKWHELPTAYLVKCYRSRLRL